MICSLYSVKRVVVEVAFDQAPAVAPHSGTQALRAPRAQAPRCHPQEGDRAALMR